MLFLLTLRQRVPQDSRLPPRLRTVMWQRGSREDVVTACRKQAFLCPLDPRSGSRSLAYASDHQTRVGVCTVREDEPQSAGGGTVKVPTCSPFGPLSPRLEARIPVRLSVWAEHPREPVLASTWLPAGGRALVSRLSDRKSGVGGWALLKLDWIILAPPSASLSDPGRQPITDQLFTPHYTFFYFFLGQDTKEYLLAETMAFPEAHLQGT